jgi:oxygen-independent coproporphyrinogen-3 oxidase
MDMLPQALLQQHDVPGPRYTSYPTADRFVDSFGADDSRAALERRAASDAPLSVYVHIPFCESVCYYCACNKIVTRHHDEAGPYLRALERELELQLVSLRRGMPLTQLHLGGGSPTFLNDDELAALMALLRGGFDIRSDAELSIEVDPRTVDRTRLHHLAALGFNRLSFGVQDFDPQVQQAVHRVQPFDSVRALMQAARAIGFRSINVDLIYGLPKQTPQSFERTVAQVGSLRPDRIALYAYAHLPQRFKPQRRIDAAALPDAASRVQMLGHAIAGFLARGYAHIGMDHFALADDALAVARREGRLHRNFQGYSTQPDCDLIALGVSAIGKVGDTYSQNAKTLAEYEDALRHGRLPVVRGLALTPDDRLRRDVVMALMCQGRVDIGAVEQAHGIDFAATFAAELEQVDALARQGLAERDAAAIRATPRGWYFIRALAMVFDRHLQADRERARDRFSRIV